MSDLNEIGAALAKLQAELPRITKAEKAKIQGDKAKFEYSYADLAGITEKLMPILGKLGLSFTARPTMGENGFGLEYMLLHSSGQHLSGRYPLQASGSPQAIGSAITYARRYSLCAVTGVAPDDDDDGAAANAAHEHVIGNAPPITSKQEVAIHQLWVDLGFGGDENHEQRMNITRGLLRITELESTSDLLEAEAHTLITALKRRKTRIVARADKPKEVAPS